MDKTIKEITIEDFRVSQEKMCKKNLDTPDGVKIEDVYIQNVQVIDEDTIVENSPIKKESNNNNTPQNDDKEEYEQISIFDEMGD